MRFATWLMFVVLATGVARADEPLPPITPGATLTPPEIIKVEPSDGRVPVLQLRLTNTGGLSPTLESLNALAAAVPYNEHFKGRVYFGPPWDGAFSFDAKREGLPAASMSFRLFGPRTLTKASFNWVGDGHPDAEPTLSLSYDRRALVPPPQPITRFNFEWRVVRDEGIWRGKSNVDGQKQEFVPGTNWREFVTLNRDLLDEVVIPTLMEARESMPALPEFPWTTDEPDSAPPSP